MRSPHHIVPGAINSNDLIYFEIFYFRLKIEFLRWKLHNLNIWDESHEIFGGIISSGLWTCCHSTLHFTKDGCYFRPMMIFVREYIWIYNKKIKWTMSAIFEKWEKKDGQVRWVEFMVGYISLIWKIICAIYSRCEKIMVVHSPLIVQELLCIRGKLKMRKTHSPVGNKSSRKWQLWRDSLIV